jgi:hypothetical protein
MRFTPFAFAGGQEFLIDYLIVGGGSRGTNQPTPVGGGAGKVVSGSIATYSGDIFDIVVGAGGSGSVINGETSSLQIKSSTTYYAQGGSGSKSGNGFVAGTTGDCSGVTSPGGGGGAGANGGNGTCADYRQPVPGNGGIGLLWLNGIYYGGGGGAGLCSGGTEPFPTGNSTGGLGGGGNGGGRQPNPPYGDIAATSGLNGFGGGGGGQGYSGGGPGNGGSGSVIIRYPAPQRAYGGNTIIESGSYVYHTFTSNGTLTT